MGHRRTQRLRMVYPVRIWGETDGIPFEELAHTLDISAGGACLGDVRTAVAKGDLVNLQYKGKRALFRVAWVGEAESARRGQIGLALLDAEKRFWTEVGGENYQDQYQPRGIPAEKAPVKSSLTPTRRSTRVKFRTLVRIESIDRELQIAEDVYTFMVNMHGCGVESEKAIPLHTRVSVKVQGTGLGGTARVVGCVPTGNRCILGLELDSPANLWGITGVPDDWGAAPSGKPSTGKLMPLAKSGPAVAERSPGAAPVSASPPAAATVVPTPTVTPGVVAVRPLGAAPVSASPPAAVTVVPTPTVTPGVVAVRPLGAAPVSASPPAAAAVVPTPTVTPAVAPVRPPATVAPPAANAAAAEEPAFVIEPPFSPPSAPPASEVRQGRSEEKRPALPAEGERLLAEMRQTIAEHRRWAEEHAAILARQREEMHAWFGRESARLQRTLEQAPDRRSSQGASSPGSSSAQSEPGGPLNTAGAAAPSAPASAVRIPELARQDDIVAQFEQELFKAIEASVRRWQVAMAEILVSASKALRTKLEDDR